MVVSCVASSPRLMTGPATSETAKHILEAASAAGVRGVLWTGGGEPLIWQPLSDMLRFSAKLSMVNAIYTNGVQLGLFPTLAESLLAPATMMVFIRVSINAASPDTTTALGCEKSRGCMREPSFKLGLFEAFPPAPAVRLLPGF